MFTVRTLLCSSYNDNIFYLGSNSLTSVAELPLFYEAAPESGSRLQA